jgi:Glycosyl transferase family 2
VSAARPVLAGLARVKNEADIVEAFVRHHAALLDHLVVVDNASSDGTREILAALQAERLPLTVLDDATFVYRQAEITTYLARAAFAHLGCARLFLLDADEFLAVPDRRALDAALAAIPAETHALLPWRTYVPRLADDPHEPEPLRRIGHRRAAESVADHKIALSASFARDPSATIAQGSHGIAGGAAGTTAAALDELVLAHFPLRSAAQLAIKTLVGWNAYIAMGYEEAGYAYQWQRSYAAIVADPAAADAAFFPVAAGWPGEPLEPAGVALVREPLAAPSIRYADLRVLDATLVLARALEQLSRQFASTAARAERVVPALLRTAEWLAPVAANGDLPGRGAAPGR